MELHQELLDREPRESPGREDLRQCRHLSPFNVNFQNLTMTMFQLGGEFVEALDLAFPVFEDQIIGFIGVQGNRSQTHGMEPKCPFADRLSGSATGKVTLYGRRRVEAMDLAAVESGHLGVE